MAHYCSECTYLKIDGNTNYEKFWCDAKYEWHAANELECYRFCRAYSRSDSVSRSAYEYSKDHTTSSGCYLTTIMCSILKAPDSNGPLNAMRKFRDNVLQKDNRYRELLLEYDIVGPKIANNLQNDPNNLSIAVNCFYNYIIPTIKLTKENKYDEAVNKYRLMTNSLIELYDIDRISITDEMIDSMDMENSGHGIYKKKLLSE